MNVSPVVSVVIPVYNVERYLEDCVKSVLNQTLRDIEIILVNDGSQDSSSKLCDHFAAMDSRIKVLHKENGGLSSARNAGVAIASANLIGFVDSDDVIEPTMYEVLYDSLISANSDIAFCGMWDYYVDEKRPSYQLLEGTFTVSGAEAIKMVLEARNAGVSAVTKLYKKKILQQHPFLEGKTFEDAHFIIPYLTDCQTASFDMRPQYHYIHREGTITTKAYHPSDLSIIEAYKNNLKIVEKSYPQALEAAEFRRFWSMFYVLDKLLKADNSMYEDTKQMLIGELKAFYCKIMMNRLVGKGRKLAMTGLMFHESIYRFCLERYTAKYKKLKV